MTLQVFTKVYLMGCDFPMEMGVGRNPSFRVYMSDRDSSLELRSSVAEVGVRTCEITRKLGIEPCLIISKEQGKLADIQLPR